MEQEDERGGFFNTERYNRQKRGELKWNTMLPFIYNVSNAYAVSGWFHFGSLGVQTSI